MSPSYWDRPWQTRAVCTRSLARGQPRGSPSDRLGWGAPAASDCPGRAFPLRGCARGARPLAQGSGNANAALGTSQAAWGASGRARCVSRCAETAAACHRATERDWKEEVREKGLTGRCCRRGKRQKSSVSAVVKGRRVGVWAGGRRLQERLGVWGREKGQTLWQSREGDREEGRKWQRWEVVSKHGKQRAWDAWQQPRYECGASVTGVHGSEITALNLTLHWWRKMPGR